MQNELPEDAIQIGGNSWYTKVVDKNGKWIAINELHYIGDKLCGGWVPFDVESEYLYTSGDRWTVVSYDPLELSPSLLCGCGHHGFIRQGKWISC